jgi:hypothetical protein
VFRAGAKLQFFTCSARVAVLICRSYPRKQFRPVVRSAAATASSRFLFAVPKYFLSCYRISRGARQKKSASFSSACVPPGSGPAARFGGCVDF